MKRWGDTVYRETYQALLDGEVLQKGSKGDAAKGLQQTLIAFGQGITADGSAGPKTFAALNQVQSSFGGDETETLDAEGYFGLLLKLLAYTDAAGAERLQAECSAYGDDFQTVLDQVDRYRSAGR